MDRYEKLGCDYHWRSAAAKSAGAKKRGGSKYRVRIESVLSLFPKVGGGASLLDVGCGDGFPASLLVARGFRVVGVDPHEGALAVARAKVPNARFQPDWPAEPFDYVLACHSLEHMADPSPLVEAVLRCRRFAVIALPAEEIGLHQYEMTDLERLFTPLLIDDAIDVDDSSWAVRMSREAAAESAGVAVDRPGIQEGQPGGCLTRSRRRE